MSSERQLPRVHHVFCSACQPNGLCVYRGAEQFAICNVHTNHNTEVDSIGPGAESRARYGQCALSRTLAIECHESQHFVWLFCYVRLRWRTPTITPSAQIRSRRAGFRKVRLLSTSSKP